MEKTEKFIVTARWVVEKEFEIEGASAEEVENQFFHDVFHGDYTELPKGDFVQGSFKIEGVKAEREYFSLSPKKILDIESKS